MAKLEFKYYLHDDFNSSEALGELQRQDSRFTRELVENMGRPFYEVTLLCEVDTETAKVVVLGVTL